MAGHLPAALALQTRLVFYEEEEMPEGWRWLDLGGQFLFPRRESSYLTMFVRPAECFWTRGLEIIIDPESGPFEVYAQIRDAIAFATKGEGCRGAR